MKKILVIIFFGLLTGCQFFESDKYFLCINILPVDGEKFPLIVSGQTVKVNDVTYERCKSSDATLTFSDNCKELGIGYMGTLDLITGRFYSTIKDTKDSYIRNFTKGECNKVEKM